MREFVTNFLRNDSGATAIEYAFFASGIGLVIILAVQAIGLSLNLVYGDESTGF